MTWFIAQELVAPKKERERWKDGERERKPTGYKILLNGVSRQAGIFAMVQHRTRGAENSHLSEKSPEIADRTRPKGALQVGGRHDIAGAENKIEGCTDEGLPAWTKDQMLFPPHPPHPSTTSQI